MVVSGASGDDGVIFSGLATLVLLTGVFGGAVLGGLPGGMLLVVFTNWGGVMLCTDEEARDW